MNAKSLLKAAAIGAGLTILLIGIAVAQTTPPAPAAPPVAAPPAAAAPAAPSPPTMTRREIADACRAEIKADLRGPERREAMRQCVEKKRESAGLNRREDRRADRETRRGERRAMMQECRKEFAEQRLTEAERRDAIQGCLAKKDPRFARMQECRKQAEEKKLERGSREFRQHMRSCNQAG
ncbi:MAG: hypothetical protein J0L51_11480 [Rhizobiales bacterium]|nr:hypothetical protein [Hyphomicrobiales bacterium]